MSTLPPPDDKKTEPVSGVNETPENAAVSQPGAVSTTGVVEAMQTTFARKLETALDTAQAAFVSVKQHNYENQSGEIAEINGHLKKVTEELKMLLDIERKLSVETKKILSEMLARKKISKDTAQELLDLYGHDNEFEAKWNKLTQNLTGENEEPLNRLKQAITSEAKEYKRVSESYLKCALDLRKLLDKAEGYINNEAIRRQKIVENSRYLGFDLKVGKVLRVKDKRPVLKETEYSGKKIWEQTGEEFIYRKATIKEINFDDIELNSEGGQKYNFPTLEPNVIVEFEDNWPDTRGDIAKDTAEFSIYKLKQVADSWEMSDVFTHRDSQDPADEIRQLKELTGVDINIGETLEYREQTFSAEKGLRGDDKQVTIVDIWKQKNPIHEPGKETMQTMINLSEDVLVGQEPNYVRKSQLTLEEFAKWCKRVEPAKPMSIEELKEKLKEEAEERNVKYARNPEYYHAISVEPGEVLYYDTNPPQPFVIKSVDEHGIIMDTGTCFTAASFLRWVKDNEVEKRDPESEAAKRVALEQDEEKKKEEFRVAKLEEEKKLEDLKEKREVDEAVLPHEEHHAHASRSSLMAIWNETYILRGVDLYEIGKNVYEFYEHHWHRKQKERVGRTGQMMFAPIYGHFGGDFEQLYSNAEMENVKHYQDAFKNFGVYDLYDRLAGCHDKDELRAILYTLADKGAIRWDDPTVIHAINHVGHSVTGFIEFHDFNEQLIQKNLDLFWGEQTYNEISQKNFSSYNSIKNNFVQESKRMENDPLRTGGIRNALKDRLARHIKGEWVDPAEFEGYLHFAIEAGKLTFEEKIFFIFMGLGAMSKSTSGYSSKPLLSFVRVGDIAGSLLGKYPILDYFTNAGSLPKYDTQGRRLKDADGKLAKGKMDQNYVKKIIGDFIESEKGAVSSLTEPAKLTPSIALKNFVERRMVLDEAVQIRISEKASRDMGNWDHDDYHIFASHLGENQIEQISSKSGAVQQSSIAAIKNAYVGLNHYTNIHLEEFIKSTTAGDEDQSKKHLYWMVNALRSFVRLDACLDRRFYHENHDRTRVSTELNGFANADTRQSRTVKAYNNEMRSFITRLIQKMKSVDPAQMQEAGADPTFFDALSESWNIVNMQFSLKQVDDVNAQKEAVKNFGTNLSQAVNIVKNIVGNEGLVEMFKEVQFGQTGKSQLVKGIPPEITTKVEEKENQPYDLEAIRNEEIRDRIDQINRLLAMRQKVGTKTEEQLKEERDQRVNEIMRLAEQNKFKAMTDRDVELLDLKIQELQKPDIGPQGRPREA